MNKPFEKYLLKIRSIFAKRLIVPGLIVVGGAIIIGFALPAYKSWQERAPLRVGHITYVRSPCTVATVPGACPAYRLDVFGDGKVIYRSISGTKVTGSLTYKVPGKDMRDFIRDFSVSAFWQNRVAPGPDIHGGSCDITLRLEQVTQRNGCLKWPPGSDQAANDPGVADSIAQLEALTRVNSLARGDAGTEALLKSTRPYREK